MLGVEICQRTTSYKSVIRELEQVLGEKGEITIYCISSREPFIFLEVANRSSPPTTFLIYSLLYILNKISNTLKQCFSQRLVLVFVI